MKSLLILLFFLDSCFLFGWYIDSKTVIIPGNRDYEQAAALRIQSILEKATGYQLRTGNVDCKGKRIIIGADATIKPALKPGELFLFCRRNMVVVAGGDAAGINAAVKEFALLAGTVFFDTPFETTRKGNEKLWVSDLLEYRYAPVSRFRRSGGRFQFRITESTVIVCPEQASPCEKRAAEELRKYLSALSGVVLNIAASPGKGSNILVGGHIAGSRLPEIDFSRLREDEIIIDTPDANTLILAGKSPRATLYAVYELLEEQFGVLFLAPDCEIIPKHAELKIPELHVAYAPPFAYRQASNSSSPVTEEEAAFLVKSRINGCMFRKLKLPKEWGGYHYMDMSHSLDPELGRWFQSGKAKKLLEAHPEYRAFRKDSDQRETHQFCLSNPEARSFILQNMLAYRAENPTHNIFSFGAGDNKKQCQCENCEAMHKKYKSNGAGVWFLANEAASLLRRKHPESKILVQLYGLTSEIPEGFQLDPGISVGMAFHNRSHGHPVSGANITAYGHILKPEHIYSWDYFTNFTYYMLPIPNLSNIPVNLKRYAMLKNHGVYAQMPSGLLGDFSAYRLWLFAQCAWNPDKDPEKLFNIFFDHYYGSGAPFLKEYARSRKLAHWQVQGNNFISDYSPGIIRWLDAGNILNALSLVNKGLKAVEGQIDYTRRVRFIKAGLLLACLLHYDEINAKAIERNQPLPSYAGILKELKILLKESKTIQVSEKFSLRNMLQGLQTQSAMGQKNHPSFKKK